MRLSIRLYSLCFTGLLLGVFQSQTSARIEPLRVLAAWPSDPLTVQVALDRPLDLALLDRLTNSEIPFRVHAEDSEPTGTLRVAGARLEDDGQTLVLLTDPHPTESTYTLNLPGLDSPATYDLSGVEAQWVADGADETEPSWTGWLPELNLTRAREQTKGSLEHDRAFTLFSKPGTLILRTLLDLPEGETVIDIEASVPFEPELAFEPAESAPTPEGKHLASFPFDSFGEAVELYLTLPTGGDTTIQLQVSTRPAKADNEDSEAKAKPLPRQLQVLPWAPPPSLPTEAPAELPAEKLGGDPKLGEAVFFGDQGKCSACHKVNGQGEAIGPDLSQIASKYDAATIYREIESPSSVIPPDYLPYTIATVDGRVVVGVVRAEGAEAIRVVDAEARETTVLRSEIEEIQAGSTSIMPVGLVGAIGEAGMRDLMAYLLQLRED